MSIVNPGLFLISLSFNLLFFNFSGASWLILNDGIPSVIMLYLIYTVYSLYLEMGDCNNVAVNDAEQAGFIQNYLNFWYLIPFLLQCQFQIQCMEQEMWFGWQKVAPLFLDQLLSPLQPMILWLRSINNMFRPKLEVNKHHIFVCFKKLYVFEFHLGTLPNLLINE